MPRIVITIFLFLITLLIQAQKQDSLSYSQEEVLIKTKNRTDSLTQSLTRSPLKASLYSAILPGLGQLYNKKYIKAPIVLGVVATGVGFIKHYDDRYKKYHKAYLAELAGKSHEFSDIEGINARVLANAQDSERRNRDYAIVLTTLAYLLNIVDAAVDAHLSIFDKDKDLAVKPVILEDPNSLIYNQKLGLAFSFSF